MKQKRKIPSNCAVWTSRKYAFIASRSIKRDVSNLHFLRRGPSEEMHLAWYQIPPLISPRPGTRGQSRPNLHHPGILIYMPKELSSLINLHGKVAIVTGGAMGIGYGIAYRLAEAGASVVIADMHKAAADLAAQKIGASGHSVMAVETNVADKDQVRQMIDTTVAAFGRIDILVNNAGIYPTIPVMSMTAEDFDRVISINLKGVFLCSQAAAAQMITQGGDGKIINITSIDALHPSAVGLAHYDASKHGVWGFTKNLALELAPHGIWVNAIAPGGISTPGAGADAPASPQLEEVRKAFSAKIPMRRFGEADEIGKVALFLASDLSSYMTGSQIVVDGGYLLA